MTRTTQIPDMNAFYRLPFEKGTFTLTEKTLNLNSTIQKPNHPFPIRIRNICFWSGILVLGVKIEEESERRIFLMVTEQELLACCDAGTDPSYLSRHVYFGLFSLLEHRSSKCFKRYYWPDFFDAQTGKSKFLTIYNDRQGLDIEVKPKYPHFYRPGDELIKWHPESASPERELPEPLLADEPVTTELVLGYFLADVNMSSIHSNHYPFLVPFLGIPNKDRQRIKSFISIISGNQEIQGSIPTPIQRRLNAICSKMRELAPVDSVTWRNPFSPNAREREQGSQLLELWHEAMRLILSQTYVYHYHTHGLKYLFEKPMRRWASSCVFRKERPQLVITRLDRGDYFQFELRFRVRRKLHIPQSATPAFFVSASTDPDNLYLLDQFTDYQLVLFFSRYGHKFAVLKCHLIGRIKEFIDHLAAQYELLES